jgi:hypothetical protein
MLHFLLIVIALLVIWRLMGPIAKAWTAIGGFFVAVAIAGGIIGFLACYVIGLMGYPLTALEPFWIIGAGIIGAPAALLFVAYMREDKARLLDSKEKMYAERRRLGYKD